MKKFLKDLAEVGKDIWLGFVWLVDFAYELGEIIADKVNKARKDRKVEKAVAKTEPVTEEVYNNVVLFD